MKQPSSNQELTIQPILTKFFKLLLIFLIFTLLFVGYFHRITAFTQDLGRHLLLGKIIFQTGHIPQNNLLSYTYPDFPFLNHHYLSEIIFYLIEKNFSLLGLLILTTGLVVLAFGLVYFFSLKKSHIIPLTIVSYLLLLVLFERVDLRPEIFSFLFTSLFVTILFRFREKTGRLIFFLPLFMLLWVNLHVYFFIGILLLLLFLFDAILMHYKNLKNKTVTYLVIALLLSLLATLMNPNMLKGALYPLHAFNNYGYSIEENQTIFFLESLGFKKQSIFYFKLSVVLLFISLIFNWKKTKPIDWLLAVTFSVAGAVAVRNLPLFVFACFIPFATNFSDFFLKCTAFTKNFSSQKKLLLHSLFILGLSCILIWQTIQIGQKNTFGFSVDTGATHAVDFFIKQNLKGPLFNNFDIGSYLAYRLYPTERVFVDGRPEAYPAQFFQQTYIPMQQDPEFFSQIGAKNHFNAIFFSHTDQTPWGIAFLESIVKNQDWKPIYLDDFVIIFVKKNPENKAVIEKFGMELSSAVISHEKKNNTRSFLQLASFFSKIGQPEQESLMYAKVLSLDPQNCMALYNQGMLYAQQQNMLANFYASRYQQYCK